MRHRVSELLAGARLLLRGFGTWARDPGLMLLGAIPALIVGLAMLALVVLLAFQVGGWAEALTPFADAWDEQWSGALRLALALGILVELHAAPIRLHKVELNPGVADAYHWLADQPPGAVMESRSIRAPTPARPAAPPWRCMARHSTGNRSCRATPASRPAPTPSR